MIFFLNFDNTELKRYSKINFCFRKALLGGKGLMERNTIFCGFRNEFFFLINEILALDEVEVLVIQI